MAADERNQRILIIDDNAAIHEDIRKILGSAGEGRLRARTRRPRTLFGSRGRRSCRRRVRDRFRLSRGRKGWQMVQRALDEGRPYAMAFVDVRMPPGWDGIETISRIWKMYPELQVVICTAYSDYSWEEMIRKVGKTDSLVILKKPFDNVEVLQLAHTLTHKWTLSHRLQCHLAGLDEMVDAAHRGIAIGQCPAAAGNGRARAGGEGTCPFPRSDLPRPSRPARSRWRSNRSRPRASSM